MADERNKDEEIKRLRDALKTLTDEIGVLKPGQTPNEEATARFHRAADQARGALNST